MGAFFIAADAIASRCGEKLDAAHRAAGFQLARKVVVGGHVLFLYRKLDGEGGLSVDAADGSLACLAGQLVYRGACGEEGLKLYCADLARDAVDRDRVIGQHALLLCRDSSLRIATDAMGFFQVYVNVEAGVASSSFWAMLELLPTITLEPAGIYEYAWNGATFGGKTFIQEIRRLPADAEIVVDGRMTVERRLHPPIPAAAPLGPATSLDDYAETHGLRLKALFTDLVQGFGEDLQVSFSSGFDSRLMLAGLKAAGLRPRLFVYGRPGDTDVDIARQVADGEGLRLNVIDKSRLATADTVTSPARQDKDFVRFDAWKVDGIFDDGVDARDRQSRHRGRGVPLNGSLGEIYRNFFYIPDRPMNLADVVDSFFSAYSPAACTARFSATAYTRDLVLAFQTELGSDETRVSRALVESLYPLVRGRYWTGRDVNLNLRFGRMIFPFMQAQLIAGTASIPIAFKNHGRLEARIIERLDPALAAYPSGYGYRFSDPPPFKHRAKSWLTLLRPPWLRRHSYRLRFARRQPMPAYLDRAYLATFMDASMPFMRRFFILEHLHDPDAFNRVATMEHIFQRYSARE
jgi:hypothetical protein